MQQSTDWLCFRQRTNQLCLLQKRRFEAVLQTLDDPRTQTPTLTLLLGKRRKDASISHLFPSIVRSRRAQRKGVITLDVAPNTVKDTCPLFFAECDPYPQSYSKLTSRQSRKDGSEIKWHHDPTHWASMILLVRALFVLADTVCIYASDYGGLDGVERLLEVANAIGPTTTSPPTTLPVLIIVHEEQIESEVVKKGLPTSNLFSRTVFHSELYDDTQKRGGEGSSLHREIVRQLRLSTAAKSRAHVLFTAVHQQSFLRHLVNRSSQTTPPGSSCDLLLAARQNHSSGGLIHHLHTFLSSAIRSKISYDLTGSMIASCLLMDAYPPSMHFFDPDTIFDHLYRQDCMFACRRSIEAPSQAVAMCQAIESNFKHHAKTLSQGWKSARIRKAVPAAEPDLWKILRSNQTCYGCLIRQPEHVLSCGHSICDTCVEVFGDGLVSMEAAFVIRQCCICDDEIHQTIRLKPRTAAARLLSIDGGGTRGVIPLEVLSLFQELLGETPLQELFDYTIGTSAGGLIILGLFAKGWNVHQAQSIFKSLTKKFFQSSEPTSNTVLGQCRRLFKSAVNDYVYDVEMLEKMLINLYGENLLLFSEDTSARLFNTKIAVTATTESEPTARLFTNYNGPDQVQENCGYLVERPSSVDKEPKIWQVARATSAVPVLFPSIRLEDMGIYWDGALSRHNNPTSMALWESQRLWPHDNQPDVVVSLGTGTKSGCSSSEKPHGFWDALKQRGVPKLWSSLMLFLEGEESWRDLCNRLTASTKQDYFRFNVLLPEGPPALSDISSMSSLCDSVRTQSQGTSGLTDAVSALMVSCFYFELDGIPVERIPGIFAASGTIRCRLRRPRDLIHTLRRSYTGQVRIFNGDNDTGLVLEENDMCSACHRYRRRVELVTESLHEIVNLQFCLINEANIRFRRLSSMPKPLDWFVDTQQLDNPFGAPNHGSPGRLQCASCYQAADPVHAKTLKRTATASSKARKRRRATLE